MPIRRMDAGGMRRGPGEILNLMRLGLQLMAGAGGLILLFVGLVAIRLWTDCLEWWAGGPVRT